jgi:hypothetical protein
VARGGTYALWSLCKSKQNRMLIKKAGGFPLLAKLIKSKAGSNSRRRCKKIRQMSSLRVGPVHG